MPGSLNGRRLLALSEDMVMGTNVVLYLSRQERRTAGLEEIADGLGTTHDKAWHQVSRLVRHGIIACENGAEGPINLRFRLRNGADRLTLADVARATGDWLSVAPSGMDDAPHGPGLSQALSVVRERVLADLDEMSVTACARPVALAAGEKNRRVS